MRFLLRNLTLTPGQDEAGLGALAARTIGLQPADLHDFHIVRKGVDARKKPRVLLVYTVTFALDPVLASRLPAASVAGLEPAPPAETLLPPPRAVAAPAPSPIIIVGMGPAGLFCALRLARHGLTATVLERGKPVEERVGDVARFWRDGLLDRESNVQFGEGGAGTFSDGKLTCRLRDPNSAWVLEELVRFGAPPEIRYLAKPHVGTDRLRSVVAAARRHLQQLGFDLRFSTRLDGIAAAKGSVSAARLAGGAELACRHLVLAIGHSARDTYTMLARCGLPMERKPFAIGLRVEHPQGVIDRIQYGRPHPALPRADYALTWNNTASGRSCYSFCMCPGGLVVAGSSEEGMVVTNGMSNLGRDSGLANSALVVNVRPEDFGDTDPLAGVRFQQTWEQRAFTAGGGSYRAPAANLLTFLGSGRGRYASSYRPGTVEADLTTVLPPYVTETLREGIPAFGRKMKGFVTAEATLTGVETRTSAPLRILRDESCQSLALEGLYPAGEGAGYAGGIMSAALDGVRIADLIALRVLS
ncbi:NAD(P)/FAD-dependent oxidoreductase [Trichlorobacter ammonificans]|uniref:FAD-binding domain-containing protein n=1 Tax=Trichlorobacter ammonificans TaxID=2916410 RepID=A0ABM9D700_9BACT|nr:FAD-binding protein [Trichlorobacter ammonificans]CAH2030224.1 conserved protein of unknown function [Trichlorobacter ammonificans]